MFSLIQNRSLVKPNHHKVSRCFFRNGGISRIPIATCKKPFLYKSPRNLIVPRASGIDWEFSSYIIGKGVILFTMYYCTMNWWLYRRTREDEEKKD